VITGDWRIVGLEYWRTGELEAGELEHWRLEAGGWRLENSGSDSSLTRFHGLVSLDRYCSFVY